MPFSAEREGGRGKKRKKVNPTFQLNGEKGRYGRGIKGVGFGVEFYVAATHVMVMVIFFWCIWE